MLEKALYTTLVTLQKEAETTWPHQWLDPPINDSIPEYVQQSSKGALNHPLVSNSPLNSYSGALPPLPTVLLLQNPEANAVARQNCNAAPSSSARARGGGTQNLPNAQPTTQDTPYFYCLGILLGQVSWLIYTKFGQQH